ncbi:ABC transporter substrate-binding protein [Rhizorhapis suberifaciens]|uniref:Peptide/nickel transport system substrate-binding protein n=1 Tax=Rhizorhapis suberifaciens TaxID=13656 RepID=A0A840HWS2_9SPHN|nr:ABC transporter substrate-binding protein [Rhizorhapis suberifaciens]MBB4641968.1 peptide/nickel transport system substrate-binding protein [Rhizorhapis suberifaciens]
MRFFLVLRLILTMLTGAFALGSCTGDEDTGPVVVSVVGFASDLATPLDRLPRPAARLMMEATAQGLVAFDARGDIQPALAERWIVLDSGKSYIFRLRDALWPDGEKITSKQVAHILSARVRVARSSWLSGDLDAVEEILPMTGEVVEVRLSAPRPNFLQILAQPEMGITGKNGGAGPYRRDRRDQSWMLTPADFDAGEEAGRKPPRRANRVLRAERMAIAIVRFREEKAALVLGGRYTDLPLLNFADVETRAIRVDPVQGLFGFAILDGEGFLSQAANREALSMAIERERLPTLFSLAGWAVSDSLLPDGLPMPRPPLRPRWADLSIDARRDYAGVVISGWKSRNGPIEPLRIALPPGPGSNLLFGMVSSDFARIGVPSVRVGSNDQADLALIDEVAPYDSALWYLGRISCVHKLSCSAEADQRLKEAQQAQNIDEAVRKLGETETMMMAHGGYIPLAAPVRWSLVSRRLRGFQPSSRGQHPLNHLLPEPK